MRYTQKIDKDDLKEAIFHSVNDLNYLSKQRIRLSFTVSLLEFTLLPILQARFDLIPFTHHLLMLSIGYLITVSIIYFRGYSWRIYNIEKNKKSLSKKKSLSEEIILHKDKMTIYESDVKRTVFYENILTVSETSKLIILYLDSKKLDFIMIKKPINKDVSTETAQFFFSFKRKLQELNL